MLSACLDDDDDDELYKGVDCQYDSLSSVFTCCFIENTKILFNQKEKSCTIL